MSFPLIDDDELHDESPNGEWQPEPPPESPYEVIFGAPDFSTVIRRSKTSKAKEYETRTLSALKAGFQGAVSVGDLPDAAAILKHGPGFASATGLLADASPNAARAIDILTAPDSPLLLFVFAALPFASQLLRNHEPQLQQIPSGWRQGRAFRKARAAQEKPPPRFTLKILGRRIPIRLRVHFPFKALLNGFRMQTAEPVFLVNQVFSDPKVQKELEKLGITVRPRGGE